MIIKLLYSTQYTVNGVAETMGALADNLPLVFKTQHNRQSTFKPRVKVEKMK
jgi:hypothetical protein